MIIERNISIRRLAVWAGPPFLWLAIWATAAIVLYDKTGLFKWLEVPWLPLSLVGTAVAFYVGFKNNSAYDRMWEARKIWGSIVNTSRAWGSASRNYVNDQFATESVSANELGEIHRRLIYRHIAWLYALRSQLLAVRNWEHAAQSGKAGEWAERYRRDFGIGMLDDEICQEELRRFLDHDEFERTIEFKNMATQLIDRQASELSELRRENLINDFRHMQLQSLLTELYEHQGKAERIKNYPFPRQYASSSILFVGLFLILLPFGLATEFRNEGINIYWSIPFTAIVGWLFHTMEAVGDYSENPFQGMANDIPMFSICRTIEIDLREMLGETELPAPVTPKQGILM